MSISEIKIIFTYADNGNVTVALNKDAYLNKTTLLSDVDTYVLIKKDPTKKLTTALRSMLTRWKTKNYISDTKYRTLYIKKQKNSLNLQTDTEGLHKTYIPIINKVWLFGTNSPSFLSVRGDPY